MNGNCGEHGRLASLIFTSGADSTLNLIKCAIEIAPWLISTSFNLRSAPRFPRGGEHDHTSAKQEVGHQN